MPKAPQKQQNPPNPNDEPAVRAAFVTRKGTIITGILAAAAAIVVAVIGLAGKWNEKPTPPAEKEKLIVKVVDKINGKSIGGAKVSLEASGVYAVNTSDSEGVISFPIADPKKELRLRVEADEYERDFNLRVTPADIVGAQEIRLTPVAKSLPTATPAIPSKQPSTIPTANTISILHGQVIDETGGVVPGARVTVSGFGSVDSDESGNFKISVPVGKGRTIDLRVTKEGFRARTQEHIVNNDSVKILLRR